MTAMTIQIEDKPTFLCFSKRVRLGEYDIANEGQDCAPVEANGEDCTDGVTRIAIERAIPHPQYNPVSPQKRHDIALLRLKETAPFTGMFTTVQNNKRCLNK